MPSADPQPLAVTIRAYRSADAAAMAQLYFDSARTLGLRSYTPEQVTAWAPAPADPARVHARASDGRATWIAVDEAGRLLGYTDLEADGHIDHLYCSPQVAGRGVASRLLEALITSARDQGLRRLYVEASELARPVFERKGFAVTARRDFHIGDVAIHNWAMERQLG